MNTDKPKKKKKWAGPSLGALGSGCAYFLETGGEKRAKIVDWPLGARIIKDHEPS